MPRTSKVQFWQARNKRWYFHKRAANGQIVGPSQGYASSQGCRRAAKREHPGLAIERV